MTHKIANLAVLISFLWSNLVWACPSKLEERSRAGGSELCKLSAPSQVTALAPVAGALVGGQKAVKQLTGAGIRTKEEFYRELSKGRAEELAGVPCLVFSGQKDPSRLAYYVFTPDEPYFSRITNHTNVEDSLWDFMKFIGIDQCAVSDVRRFIEKDKLYYQQVFAIDDTELEFINTCLKNACTEWKIRIERVRDSLKVLQNADAKLISDKEIVEVIDRLRNGMLKLKGEDIDVLNEDGQTVLGRIDRNIAHDLGLWHRTVHVLVVNMDGDVLLQRRAEKQGVKSAGKWDVSSGGHVRAGMTPDGTVLRELIEELGFELTKEDLIKVGDDFRKDGNTDVPEGEEGYADGVYKYYSKEWNREFSTLYIFVTNDSEEEINDRIKRNAISEDPSVKEVSEVKYFKPQGLSAKFAKPGERAGYASGIKQYLVSEFYALITGRIKKALSEKTLRTLVKIGDDVPVSVIGNKARSFVFFDNLGLLYPEGFVIPSEVVERIVGGDENLLRLVTDGLLKWALKAGILVSVRSSPSVSCPGRFKTILDVKDRQELVCAIKTVTRDLPSDLHMAVIVQKMVCGDKNNNSCSGVVFSRNPNTGEKGIFGNFKANAKGKEIVSGQVSGERIEKLKGKFPDVFHALQDAAEKLEKETGYPQEIEFTVEDGVLYFLQTRNIIFSPEGELAYLKEAGDVSGLRLLPGLSAIQMRVARRKVFKFTGSAVNREIICSGETLVSGAMMGRLAFSIEKAREFADGGDGVILVSTSGMRDEIMKNITRFPRVGLVTFYGNASSHEAVVMRSAGIPVIRVHRQEPAPGNNILGRAKEGDLICLDAGVDACIFFPNEEDVFTESGVFLDATYGIDISEYGKEFVKPYLDSDGEIKDDISYEYLLELNISAWLFFHLLNEGAKDDVEVRKAVFIANIEKHFLHELFLKKADSTGRKSEEAETELFERINKYSAVKLLKGMKPEKLPTGGIAIEIIFMIVDKGTDTAYAGIYLTDGRMLYNCHGSSQNLLERIIPSTEITMKQYDVRFCDGNGGLTYIEIARVICPADRFHKIIKAITDEFEKKLNVYGRTSYKDFPREGNVYEKRLAEAARYLRDGHETLRMSLSSTGINISWNERTQRLLNGDLIQTGKETTGFIEELLSRIKSMIPDAVIERSSRDYTHPDDREFNRFYNAAINVPGDKVEELICILESFCGHIDHRIIEKSVFVLKKEQLESDRCGDKFIVEFKDSEAMDVNKVGGKASSLAELAQIQGIDVPEGFFISGAVYESVVSSFRDEIKQLDELSGELREKEKAFNEMQEKLESVFDPGEVSDLRLKFNELCVEIYKIKENIIIQAGRIQGLIIDKIPPDLERAISERYKAMGLVTSVAVRSSATAEDLPDASFAGQHDTYLNRKGTENVLDAVKKCCASLFSERAVFYRNANGFKHSDVRLCVVVQKMVKADVSGVGFSVDRHTGEPGFLIHTVYGLGESLVGGKNTPDEYRFDTSFNLIEEPRLGDKRIKVVYDEKGGVSEIEPEESERRNFTITAEQARDIARKIAVISEYYKTKKGYRYIDTEFAIDENGRLYFLQARPDTVFSREVEKEIPEQIRRPSGYNLEEGGYSGERIPDFKEKWREVRNNTGISLQLLNDSRFREENPELFERLKTAVMRREEAKYIKDILGDKIDDDPFSAFENKTHMVDEIKNVLQTETNDVRGDVIYILGRIGGKTSAGILIWFMDYLIGEVDKLEKDEIIKDDRIRSLAAGVLASLRIVNPDIYGRIVNKIKDYLVDAGSEKRRIWAARTLELARDNSDDIVQAFLYALKNETESGVCRGMIVNALRLNRNSALDYKVLEEILKVYREDNDFEARFRAARALGHFGDILAERQKEEIVDVLKKDHNRIKKLRSRQRKAELQHVMFFTIFALGRLRYKPAECVIGIISKEPPPPTLQPGQDGLNAAAKKVLALLNAEVNLQELKPNLLFPDDKKHFGDYRTTGIYDGVNSFYTPIIKNLMEGGRDLEPERRRGEVFGNIAFHSLEEEENLEEIIRNLCDIRDSTTLLFEISHAPTQRSLYMGPSFSAPALHQPERDALFTKTENDFIQETRNLRIITRGVGFNIGGAGVGFKVHDVEAMDGRYIGSAITLFLYDVLDAGKDGIRKGNIQNVRILGKKEAIALNYLLKHENLIGMVLRSCNDLNITSREDIGKVIDEMKNEEFFAEYAKKHYPLTNVFYSEDVAEEFRGFTPEIFFELIFGLYRNERPISLKTGRQWSVFIPGGKKVMNVHRRHMELCRLRNAYIIPSNVPEHLTGIFIQCCRRDGMHFVDEIVFEEGKETRRDTFEFSEYVKKYIPGAEGKAAAQIADGARIISVVKDAASDRYAVCEKGGTKYIVKLSEKSGDVASGVQIMGEPILDVSGGSAVGKSRSFGRIIKAPLITRELLKRKDFDRDEPVIIVTDYTEPQAVPVLMELNVAGLITRDGGITSHAALVANEFSIPTLLGVGQENIDRLTDGEYAVIHSREGKVYKAQKEAGLYQNTALDIAVAFKGEVYAGDMDEKCTVLLHKRKEQSRIDWESVLNDRKSGSGLRKLLPASNLFNPDGSLKPRFGVSEVVFVQKDGPLYAIASAIQAKIEDVLPDKFRMGHNLHLTILGLQTGQSVPVSFEDRKRIIEEAGKMPRISGACYTAITGVFIDPNGAVCLEVFPIPVDGEDLLQKRISEWQKRLATAKRTPSPLHITLGVSTGDISSGDLERLLEIVEPLRDKVMEILEIEKIQVVHHHDIFLDCYDELYSYEVRSGLEEVSIGEDSGVDEEGDGKDLRQILDEGRTVVDIQHYPERWVRQEDGIYTNGFAFFYENDRLIFDSENICIIYSPESKKIFIYFSCEGHSNYLAIDMDAEFNVTDSRFNDDKLVDKDKFIRMLSDARINIKYQALYSEIMRIIIGREPAADGKAMIESVGGSIVKKYGHGIFAVVDEIRVSRFAGRMVKDGDKNILLLDADAFSDEKKLFDALERGLVESIMSIIPCENDEEREQGLWLALQVFNDILEKKAEIPEEAEINIKVVKTFIGTERVVGLEGLPRRLQRMIGVLAKQIYSSDKFAGQITVSVNRKYIAADEKELEDLKHRIGDEEYTRIIKTLDDNNYKVCTDLPKEAETQDIIRLVSPAGIKDMPQIEDILYLPFPYTRSSLYMAALVLQAGGDLSKVPLVKVFLREFYTELSDDDLTLLITQPWQILPKIQKILDNLEGLLEAIAIIEKAA